MSTEHVLTPFLNRDGGAFDPAGWFQLVPKGVFRIKRNEGGKTVIYEQVVDDVAVTRMAEAFANRQATTAGYKLLIDFEHFSHDLEKSSSAAAWVNKVEARVDGLWAQADWSDEGEAAIKNRRYRYLSPVWLPSQVESLGPQRVRPVAVNDAGLTNKPNLGAALQPFWNRSEESISGQPANENQNNHIAMKEQLIALFGLAATASEADILAKAAAFKNRVIEADALQGKFDTLNTEHTAFKNRHKELLTVSVDRTLEEFKGVITEESKEAWKNRLTEDFTGTTALLKGIKPAATTDKKAPVHQPGRGAAASAKKGEGEDEGCPFMNRVKELQAADGKLSEADAMYHAAEADPALYEEYRQSLSATE
ncbi:MAG: mu-like prophage Flumu protein [Rariglobus sp.]|jgi:phage I-like protein|nr:mu-like prophage Flumu protein [Rariglobus sp.]